MRNLIILLPCILLVFLLGGCMYPEENLAQNKIPYKVQIESVQKAVNDFRAANSGILPIKTKEADTPIYEKYLIDFQRIVPRYMAEPPGNAFESGGVFQYVLVNAETDPEVKLLDLRMAETIREIKLRIRANDTYPPFKEQIGKNVFTLNYKKLGYKEDPVAVSPYTGRNLPFIISGEGEVYVDYRSDLYQKLKDGKHKVKPGDDIRSILVENSEFVPGFSLPYTIHESNGEPIFLEK